MIDAHQHFWSVERDDYGWLSPSDEVLYRDYAPEHLLPLITEAKIDATVLVQAAPTLAETRYLLGIAAEAGLSGPWRWALAALFVAHPMVIGPAATGSRRRCRRMSAASSLAEG